MCSVVRVGVQCCQCEGGCAVLSVSVYSVVLRRTQVATSTCDHWGHFQTVCFLTREYDVLTYVLPKVS